MREGYKTDVVVFDFAGIKDRATIMEPGLYSDGIQYVLVNGKFTVDAGECTGALPGVVLDKNEIRPRALGQQPGRTEGVH